MRWSRLRGWFDGWCPRETLFSRTYFVSKYRKTGIIMVLLCVTLLTSIMYSKILSPGSPSPGGGEPLPHPGSNATHIFTGTVLSIEPRWVNESGSRRTYSWAEIEVDWYIRGEGAEVVTVKYPGGPVEESSIIHSYDPGGELWLKVGEKVTVYARLVEPDEGLFTTLYVEHRPEGTHKDSIIATVEIYRLVVHTIYNHCGFTRGREVVIFIDPMARTPNRASWLLYEGEPLSPELLEALESLPAKEVSFAYRWEVIGPMSTGGTVREGGAFITLGVIYVLNDNEVEVLASIYYANLGASGWKCTLTKICGEWRITQVLMTWIA